MLSQLSTIIAKIHKKKQELHLDDVLEILLVFGIEFLPYKTFLVNFSTSGNKNKKNE